MPATEDCKHESGVLRPVVNRSKCEAKDDCVRVCPYNVFEIRKLTPEEKEPLGLIARLKVFAHGGKQAFTPREDQCHGCGLCVTACPEDSIADHPEAVEIAERIREGIAGSAFDIGTAAPLRASASLGGGRVRGRSGPSSAGELVARADTALYAAKDGGRPGLCQRGLTAGPRTQRVYRSRTRWKASPPGTPTTDRGRPADGRHPAERVDAVGRRRPPGRSMPSVDRCWLAWPSSAPTLRPRSRRPTPRG